MRKQFRFDSEPFERPIQDTPLRLQVTEAEIGDGGTRATIACYNGKPTPVYSERFLLDSAFSRKRYSTAVSRAEPGTDIDTVCQGLMVLSVDLTAKIAAIASTKEPDPPAVDVPALWALAQPLAEAPDLLERAVGAMRSRGLVGEGNAATLLYLAATARLREKPISAVVKGPSSSGKSHLIERVVELLPPDEIIDYTAVSPRFLAYSTHVLKHKIVVIYEAGGMADGPGAYIMRSLLSEGCLRMGTVDRGEGDTLEAREITKEGPTALFTSTTMAGLDAELETRALSLNTTDSQEQSRAIMRGAANRFTGHAAAPTDLAPFHALQGWLRAAGERRVIIPYARQLAEIVPTLAIRVRRDFTKLLDLIATSAMLHQAQRARTEDGAVLANLDDYRIVYGLANEVFSAAQRDGLTEKQRRAVVAVTVLQPEGNTGIGLAAIAEYLTIDKSAASRRLSNPISQGYVKNLEQVKGHPGRYVPGDKMPEPVKALPTVEELSSETEVLL